MSGITARHCFSDRALENGWKAQKDLLCLWACRGTSYCGGLEHLFLLLVFHFKVLITSVKHNDFSCCFGCKIWISPLSPSSSLSWDSLVVILVAEVWDTANVLRLQTRGICAHYFAHILNQVIPNLFGVGLKEFLIFNCYLLFFSLLTKLSRLTNNILMLFGNNLPF